MIRADLDGVSRDEEGLVDGRIDRSGLLTRIRSNGGRVDTVGRSLNRSVGATFKQFSSVFQRASERRGRQKKTHMSILPGLD